MMDGYDIYAEELMVKVEDGKITNKQMQNRLVTKLSRILSKHDSYADWLAHNFHSTAEYIGDDVDNPYIENWMFEFAMKEIDVLYKTGYDMVGEKLEEYLLEAIDTRWSDEKPEEVRKVIKKIWDRWNAEEAM